MTYMIDRIKHQIKTVLDNALEKSVEKGELNIQQVPAFTIEVPREKEHGDFATNLAMLLPRQAKMAPRQIAQILVSNMNIQNTWIDTVEAAGPGFINFFLNDRWLLEVLPIIEDRGEDYGRVDIGRGQKIQVEFVSANPTGPLHMGNARGAALGDSLANLLERAGYDVTREFYINDAGNQIVNFGLSLEARYLQLLGREAQVPENGYHGEDITEHMRNLIDEEGERHLQWDEEERRKYFIEYALKRNLEKIKQDLKDFGVEFDVWYSEQSLYDTGKVDSVIQYLREKGFAYEKDGAIWFKTSEFGAEKDDVLVRKNGIPTYFASDIAYHWEKFQRGFDMVINIWGADHHGHIPRMKGAVEALGYDPDRLHIIIMQLVRLLRNGKVVRMSKRTGKAITLRDLMDEVGVDAARFFFNMRGADTHLEFDMDLAVKKSNENPVYYVQYAHARICSILAQAEERGIPLPSAGRANLKLLGDPSEMEVLRKLADFPDEIASAAKAYEPYRLTRYVHELASLFHTFYNSCRVISDDLDLTGARLVLVKSVRQVIRNALEILGITAPERM